MQEALQQEEILAKRDRDMAIIGDTANLFAQVAAMHGGAWKINPTTSYTENANKRIRDIKKRRSEMSKLNNEYLTYLRQKDIMNERARLNEEKKAPKEIITIHNPLYYTTPRMADTKKFSNIPELPKFNK